MLLLQQAFWVGTTGRPRADPRGQHIPDNLWAFSFLALGVSAVMLVIGQLVFTRFENRIPERL